MDDIVRGVQSRRTGKIIPFKLTPRRKQILWHIAYTDEVRVRMMPAFALGMPKERAPTFYLDQTDIHKIVILLKRCRLVDFHFGAPGLHLHIKPLGMQVLLESLK